MPLTSVKIWQRPAPSRAARATAVVSDPPRPRVVISASCGASAPTLWPWNPATMTTLPWSISRRTRAGSIPAIRALPYRPSVGIPACAPVSAIPAPPGAGVSAPAVPAVGRDPGLRPGERDRRDAERVQGHRDERRRLVLAGREQEV